MRETSAQAWEPELYQKLAQHLGNPALTKIVQE